MDDRRQGSAVPSTDGDEQQKRNYNLIRCLPWLLMLALLWKAQQMQRTAQPSQLLANQWDDQHGAKSPASAVKLDWCSCPGIVQAPTLRQDPAALQLYQQMAEEVRAADQAQVLHVPGLVHIRLPAVTTASPMLNNNDVHVAIRAWMCSSLATPSSSPCGAQRLASPSAGAPACLRCCTRSWKSATPSRSSQWHVCRALSTPVWCLTPVRHHACTCGSVT